ncbi:MAG: hypothetical protein ACE5EY_07865, partial [Anaerolineae bacterium]
MPANSNTQNSPGTKKRPSPMGTAVVIHFRLSESGQAALPTSSLNQVIKMRKISDSVIIPTR